MTGDPYAAFLEKQRKREVEWASNRASKKAKVAEQSSSKDLETTREGHGGAIECEDC